jgi:hypothetical protein
LNTKFLVVKPKRRRLGGLTRSGLEDNNKMNLKKFEHEFLDWIILSNYCECGNNEGFGFINITFSLYVHFIPSFSSVQLTHFKKRHGVSRESNSALNQCGMLQE